MDDVFYDPITDDFLGADALLDRVAEYQEAYFDALERGDEDQAAAYQAALESFDAETEAAFWDSGMDVEGEDDDDSGGEIDDDAAAREDYGELADYFDDADDLADYLDFDLDADDAGEYELSFEYEESQ